MIARPLVSMLLLVGACNTCPGTAIVGSLYQGPTVAAGADSFRIAWTETTDTYAGTQVENLGMLDASGAFSTAASLDRRIFSGPDEIGLSGGAEGFVLSGGSIENQGASIYPTLILFPANGTSTGTRVELPIDGTIADIASVDDGFLVIGTSRTSQQGVWLSHVAFDGTVLGPPHFVVTFASCCETTPRIGRIGGVAWVAYDRIDGDPYSPPLEGHVEAIRTSLDGSVLDAVPVMAAIGAGMQKTSAIVSADNRGFIVATDIGESRVRLIALDENGVVGSAARPDLTPEHTFGLYQPPTAFPGVGYLIGTAWVSLDGAKLGDRAMPPYEIDAVYATRTKTIAATGVMGLEAVLAEEVSGSKSNHRIETRFISFQGGEDPFETRASATSEAVQVDVSCPNNN